MIVSASIRLVKALLTHIFLTGVLVIACGAAGVNLLERKAGFAMLQGALTLGGGLLICWLFSMRSRWHGIIGAGVLAMLGAGRGMANVPAALRWLAGDRPRGVAPVLELAVTVACLALLVAVSRALLRERSRRLTEQRLKEQEAE